MKKDIGFWDSGSATYHNLQEENRKTILFPAVLALLNCTQATKIIDYGGGDGGFLESIPVNCDKTLYDPSIEMVNIAKEQNKTINTFSTNDELLIEKGYDFITCIHVLTVIKDDMELQRIFDKFRLLLKPRGKLVIAMTHPAFKNNFFSTFHTDFSTGTLEFDYLKSPLPYKVHLNGNKPGTFVSFECYHRPVSVIVNALIAAGLNMTGLFEIEDKDFEHPQKKFNYPPFLILECNY